MSRSRSIALTAALLAFPLVHAHDDVANGLVPGTPDTTCEDTASEWADHDYGPPASGVLLSGFQESNLEDCDGDFNAANPTHWLEEVLRADLDGDTDVSERFDDDGHADYTRGGAWLLVDSGDGATRGSLACFGAAAHHPTFGPVFVVDLALGSTVPFSVQADTLNPMGPDPITGVDCGDFQSDVSTSCVATCTVTFGAGLDGSYQVYVGDVLGAPGTQGHVVS